MKFEEERFVEMCSEMQAIEKCFKIKVEFVDI